MTVLTILRTGTEITRPEIVRLSGVIRKIPWASARCRGELLR